jgi:hypothetical protein
LRGDTQEDIQYRAEKKKRGKMKEHTAGNRQRRRQRGERQIERQRGRERERGGKQ